MATRLVHLVVDAVQPGPLAQFWAAALGWEVAAEEDGESDVWPSGYRYPDPVALPLVFAPVASNAPLVLRLAGLPRSHVGFA